MSSKKKSWKLPLIIVGIVFAIFLVGVFSCQGVKNKAISYEEQITDAQSGIKVFEKKRADLIPNLVDCVRAYDKHEYETLMAVIEARGTNSDEVVDEIKTNIEVVAESYPELKSQENYKQLMTDLTTIENQIASSRNSFNTWVKKYKQYVRHFPNKQILGITGYEIINYVYLDFDVSEDAPTNLFD